MTHPQPSDPHQRRSIGSGGWVALSGALAAGLVFTVVLAVVIAVTSGSVFGRLASWAGSVDASGGSDPFDSDPFDSDPGDEADPFYDYPGYEDGDSGYVLAQPSAEEVRSTARQAIDLAQRALGGEWETPGRDTYTETENSYGGPSMLHDFSSAARLQELGTIAPTAKQEMVDELTGVLAPLGFDTVEIADDPGEWADAGYDIDGNDEVTGGDASPLWIVTFYSSVDYVPYLEFGIVDGADDAILDGLQDYEIDSTGTGVYLQAYGWNLLEESDRQSFIDAMDDFGGVEPYDDGTAST